MKVKTVFNEESIKLRVAVISDVHISYTTNTAERIIGKLGGYASAIADLHDASGGELDAVMMCGDYSSIGCEAQARTFAKGTQVIFDGVFKN